MDSIKHVVSDVMTLWSSGQNNLPAKIQHLWRNITDEKTYQHTRVVSMKDKKIFIHVDSSALLFQMNLKKKSMLKKIQEQTPNVTTIILKIGKV